MSKSLIWELCEDVYGEFWKADAGMGGEYVVQDYGPEVIGLLDEHADLFSVEAESVEDAKSACQRDHESRFDAIARANGYVKLEPGQVVVDVEDLILAVGMIQGGCRSTCEDCHDDTCYVRDLTAAIDAAGGGR